MPNDSVILVPLETPGERNSQESCSLKEPSFSAVLGMPNDCAILVPVKHPEKTILTELQLKKAKLLCCFRDAKRLRYFSSL